MSAEAIIKNDYKDFDFKAGKFGIGQIETVDLKEFAAREEDLLAKLAALKDEGGYHSVVLFITDIIEEGSKFLVATSAPEEMEKALKGKLADGKIYIPGILSRKKQVVPMMSEVFDK
jgi:manganese-dependent inorganic pyrophosphatase